MTPDNKRSPLQQTFDNYVFNYAKTKYASLCEVATSKMNQVPGSAGEGMIDDGISDIVDIGFGFKFNEITYRQFVACTNGWIALVDPAVGTFATTDVMSDGAGSQNGSINSTFVNNHVLLAPWFDDMLSVSRTPDALGYSAEQIFDAESGITTEVSDSWDEVSYGTKYVNDVSPDGQRRLVVRWNSYSYNTATLSYARLTFEVVLYEGGKLEYRYSPLKKLGVTGTIETGATIGVFMTGNKFRDMCDAVGYIGGTGARKSNPFGGYQYASTYTDPVDSTTPSYAASLKPQLHWPAGDREFAIFTFSPPQRKRDVLPRVETTTIDSRVTYPRQYRIGAASTPRIAGFDDRLSVPFVASANVDMPTGLPRGFTNGLLGSTHTANLWSEGSIVMSTTRVKSSDVDQFLSPDIVDRSAPFVDHNRPEQGMTSAFYSTGLPFESFGFGFESPLRSKTQLKFSLPVSKKTQLFEVSSSIHYYNNRFKGWFFPANSGGRTDMLDPIDQIAFYNGDGYSGGERGFNAAGNLVSSGTVPSANRTYNDTNKLLFMSSRFKDSLQNNQKYAPTDRECFLAEIDRPYLLEKATLEVPLRLGPGWFNDRTTGGLSYNGNYGEHDVFDLGGPALTFAIWNHKAGGSSTYMDLIMSGTVIPVGDNMSNVKTETTDWEKRISVEGFLAHNATPACVVSPNPHNSFTGSVRLELDAAVSNGVVLQSEVYVDPGSDPPWLDVLTYFLTTKKLNPNVDSKLRQWGSQYIRTGNPLGRGPGGMEINGRSYFGKEFTTPELDGGFVNNPVYASASYAELPTRIKDCIENPGNVPVRMSYALCYEKSTPAPYLLLPGDRLVLSVSKVRPRMFGNGADPMNPSSPTKVYDYFTGSIRHDVALNTGSINLTLYGSMVRAGREHHDPLTQDVGTAQVHEVIGNYPVVDQFEVEYRGLFEGSYTDDYLLGSLIETSVKDGKTVVSPKSADKRRRKFFGKTRPQSYDMLPSELPDNPFVLENPSKSFRLQPWVERAGDVRNLVIRSDERIYDSMVPSLLECWGIDGYKIISADGWFGTTTPNVDTQGTAGMLFNDGSESGKGSVYNNKDWTWSFPFEPRYSKLSRQVNTDTAARMIIKDRSPNIDNYIESVSPKIAKSFFAVFPNRDRQYTKVPCDVRLDGVNSFYENFEFVTVPNLPEPSAPDAFSVGWRSTGDALWTTQNTASYSGNQAAQAGVITSSETSALIYQFLASSGPIDVAFRWKVDSELGYDFLKFYFDDGGGTYTEIASTSGPDQPWTAVTASVTAGIGGYKKFKWEYSKDSSVDVGLDTAYVDQVQVIPRQYVTSSMSTAELSKIMFGFGDNNTYTASFGPNPSLPYLTSSGHNHEPFYRNTSEEPALYAPLSNDTFAFAVSPIIRGWKYGLSSGLPQYTNVVYRRGRYGQFRDMLEQRLFTKAYVNVDGRDTTTLGAVEVKFVDYLNQLPVSDPELTWSNNLSNEVTSSLPYFDGESRSRPKIDPTKLIGSTIVLTA